MVDDLANIASIFAYLVEKAYSSSSSKKERRKALKESAKILASNFKNRNILKSFAYYFYLYAYGSFAVKIKTYMKSLYLSKDYENFKKLRPIEVVRMVRFYLGKKGTKIPLNLTPFLLKSARLIKYNITAQIKYRQKKNPLLPEEVLFEELKEKHMKHQPSRKTKRTKRKKTISPLSS